MNFPMIQATVERIEENSNDVSRCLFIRLCSTKITTHKYDHGEMRNRKLINRRTDITQGWQFSSSWKKEGGKIKTTSLQHGVFVFDHPSKY